MKRNVPSQQVFLESVQSGGDSVRSERAPLAESLRPGVWDQFEGLSAFDPHLIKQLREGKGRPPSLVLWGPPGCGKTTLAKLIGASYHCRFIEISAVLSGVKDIREIVEEATHHQEATIVFIDEIHRFTKAQQDSLLPHVEKGTISLIGATTENPSFALTGALLSRTRVIVLPALERAALLRLIYRGGERVGLRFVDDAQELLVEAVGGDARKLLTLIEQIAASGVHSGGLESPITKLQLASYLSDAKVLAYDRSGEHHYDTVSAFIKSLRGSDPDAALYWGFRMIEAGEDPRFIIRRMMIFASEDIGNADPRGLEIAVATSSAYERLGLPEGKIPIAHCITYLATAPKSNRSYLAMHKAIAAIKEDPRVTVPLHLRNAPTKLMKDLGYGEEYAYPHDTKEGFVAGVRYLPEEVGDAHFYEPTDRGYEKFISERLGVIRRK